MKCTLILTITTCNTTASRSAGRENEKGSVLRVGGGQDEVNYWEVGRHLPV